MAHLGQKSASSTGFHHTKAGEGEESGRRGGGQMKGHGQLMVLLNGWNKNIGKLMVGTGNGGFAADGRSRRRTVGLRIFAG